MKSLFVAALLGGLASLHSASYGQQRSIYTLHPAAKTSFNYPNGQPFAVTNATQIVIGSANGAVNRAVAYFNLQVKQAIGDTLEVTRKYTLPAIQIDYAPPDTSEPTGWPSFSSTGEAVPPYGGYMLDIESSGIMVAATDTEGIFNGLSTLAELLNASGNSATIRAAHVWDYPDYAVRGVWSMHNLLVGAQDSLVKSIEDIMAAHKMNKIMQSDYKYGVLDLMQSLGLDWYFTNAASVQNYGFNRNIELIPSVMDIGYSNAILFHDPNLAEGFPSKLQMVIQSDTGKIIQDPDVNIPNGNFENTNNGKFTGWSFYDGSNSYTTVDHSVFHSGATSAKCVNPDSNCRFEKTVPCKPWHSYVLSCWIKTQNFSGGVPELAAIGFDTGGVSYGLTSDQESVQSTGDWTQIQVAFNTLRYTTVGLYVGVWGGFSGTMWFDDFTVRDLGFTNVVRRDGAPLYVRNHATGKLYTEGKDYKPVADSFMIKTSIATGGGSYGVAHVGPTFTVIPSGAIANGDTLDVSYYHALTTLSDNNGDGQAMVCLSEDTLYYWLNDQISRIQALYNPHTFFMMHDEIRVMNWDSACLKRQLTAAALLGNNVVHDCSIIDGIHPNADILMWSDMFDSLHNAHNNYYLVDGNLTGDWNDIPKNITIVNWDGGFMRQSLQKFSDLGFPQITSPYYDVQSTVNMRDWRIAQEGLPNIRGMMYTTWVADYSYLNQFADYAWGIAPIIFHEPLTDSNFTLSKANGTWTAKLSAEILPDYYDPTDSIVSASTIFTSKTGDSTIAPMVRDTGKSWSGTITTIAGATYVNYYITALDKNGIHRSTPLYFGIALGGLGVNQASAPSQTLSVYPCPASEFTTISSSLPTAARWEATLFDALGRTVGMQKGFSQGTGLSIRIDLHTLPTGAYRIMLKSAGMTENGSVAVIR